MAKRRVGVWLIGTKGGVATTTIVGLVALKKGLAPDCGLVSQLPEFSHLELLGFKDLSIGGHEIRQTTLFDEAMKLHTVSRVLDQELLSRCKTELDRIDKQIVPGTILNVGSTIEKFASSSLRHRVETPRQAIERIQSDYRSFLKSQQLDQLIVINLASTEPPLDDSSLPVRWKELERLLDRPAKKSPLAASSIYAIAALDLGLPYVNFTPSVGSAPPAICELALERETCHMGHDGKTGETLLKSVLAPMLRTAIWK